MALKIDEFQQHYSEHSEELRRQLKEKDLVLSQYRKEHGKLSVFFDELTRNIEPIPPPPPVFIKADTKHNICAAVMRISDPHTGASQDALEIEGLNNYSFAICEKRQMYYVDTFVGWVYRQRKSYPINDCHVIVTGDLVSGDIHQELQVTNEFPAPVAVVKATEVLVQQLHKLAPHFDKVVVEFVTEDNHGRLTKKPQAKEAGKNNYNYIIGMMAKEFLKDCENVTFNIYPQLEAVVTVLNRNYLITHGHQIRAWMGIPFYGVQRMVGKESSRRMVQMLDELREESIEAVQQAKRMGFHKFVMGHYHQWFESYYYSICPSVSGPDAYDVQCGNFHPPGQSAWLVHSEKAEFNHIFFDFSKIQ